MGKYKVGQEVLLRAKVFGVDGTQNMLSIGPNFAWFLDESLDAAIVPQPAPVADWQPKVGDMVLVECLLEWDGRISIPWNGEVYHLMVDRSAIVGPAPARARFAVGDEVVIRATLERGVIHRMRGIEELWSVKIGGAYNDYFEADMLTLAEARERLAK